MIPANESRHLATLTWTYTWLTLAPEEFEAITRACRRYDRIADFPARLRAIVDEAEAEVAAGATPQSALKRWTQTLLDKTERP